MVLVVHLGHGIVSSGIKAVLALLRISFWERSYAPKCEEPFEKKGVHFYRSTRQGELRGHSRE